MRTEWKDQLLNPHVAGPGSHATCWGKPSLRGHRRGQVTAGWARGPGQSRAHQPSSLASLGGLKYYQGQVRGPVRGDPKLINK